MIHFLTFHSIIEKNTCCCPTEARPNVTSLKAQDMEESAQNRRKYEFTKDFHKFIPRYRGRTHGSAPTNGQEAFHLSSWHWARPPSYMMPFVLDPVHQRSASSKVWQCETLINPLSWPFLTVWKAGTRTKKDAIAFPGAWKPLWYKCIKMKNQYYNIRIALVIKEVNTVLLYFCSF